MNASHTVNLNMVLGYRELMNDNHWQYYMLCKNLLKLIISEQL